MIWAEILIDSYYGLTDIGLDSQCKMAVVLFNAGEGGEGKKLSALPLGAETERNNRNISDDEYLFTLVHDPKPNPQMSLELVAFLQAGICK